MPVDHGGWDGLEQGRTLPAAVGRLEPARRDRQRRALLLAVSGPHSDGWVVADEHTNALADVARTP